MVHHGRGILAKRFYRAIIDHGLGGIPDGDLPWLLPGRFWMESSSMPGS